MILIDAWTLFHRMLEDLRLVCHVTLGVIKKVNDVGLDNVENRFLIGACCELWFKTKYRQWLAEWTYTAADAFSRIRTCTVHQTCGVRRHRAQWHRGFIFHIRLQNADVLQNVTTCLILDINFEKLTNAWINDCSAIALCIYVKKIALWLVGDASPMVYQWYET